MLNSQAFPAQFNLASLNGANGFTLNGVSAHDHSGKSVRMIGDINADGVDDFLIDSLRTNSAIEQIYVVFGSRSPSSATFNLADLNGANGFTIDNFYTYSYTPCSVNGAGDVNGDGIDDIIIGCPEALNGLGQSYVLFGRSSPFPAVFNLDALDGSNGFTINGINYGTSSGGNSGSSVSGAGDINNDGIDDFIIGAENALTWSGQSYLIFGSRTPFPAIFNLASLNSTTGFMLNGINYGERSGHSVSRAGDVNGDGIDDFIIGGAASTMYPSENYVVFGSTTPFPETLNLADLNGYNGFKLISIYTNFYDYSGNPVSGAGDINADGVDDLLITALGANGNVAQIYVIFGSRGLFPATFYLADLNGANGFTIDCVSEAQFNKSPVSMAGDVNGDGIDDIIFGLSDSNDYKGQGYVLFGSKTPFPAIFSLANLNGTNGFVLNGMATYSLTGYSVSGAGDVNGDGIADIIIGAPGAIDEPGQSYVVFGKNSLTSSPAASPSATSRPTPSMPPKTVIHLNKTNEVYTASSGNCNFIISANNVTINSLGAYNLYKLLPSADYLLTIYNFNKPTDKIDLTDFPTVSFRNLVITTGSAIVNLPNGQETIIKNLMPYDLQDNNFHFANKGAYPITYDSSDWLVFTAVLTSFFGACFVVAGAWWLIKTFTTPTHTIVHINPMIELATTIATTIEVTVETQITAQSGETIGLESLHYSSSEILVSEADSTSTYDTVN